MSPSPNLRKIIEDRLRSSLTDNSPIPYQEMIKQEMAALKEIKIKKAISKEDVAISEEKKKYFKKLSSFYYQKIIFPL
jgi:hypothetical protein